MLSVWAERRRKLKPTALDPRPRVVPSAWQPSTRHLPVPVSAPPRSGPGLAEHGRGRRRGLRRLGRAPWYRRLLFVTLSSRRHRWRFSGVGMFTVSVARGKALHPLGIFRGSVAQGHTDTCVPAVRPPASWDSALQGLPPGPGERWPGLYEGSHRESASWDSGMWVRPHR